MIPITPLLSHSWPILPALLWVWVSCEQGIILISYRISITSSSTKYQGDDGRDDQIFLATTEGDDTNCSRLQELTQLAEYQDAPIVVPIVDEIPSDHEDNDEPPSPAPI